MKKYDKRIVTSAIALGAVVMLLPSISLAALNTGGGPQKTDKQCKNEQAQCVKSCNQLIDIDNNIQRCKDRCTDAYIICTPARSSGQPSGKLGGVRPPILPGQNAPIMRRGIEGGEPDNSTVAPPDASPGSK